MMSEQELTEVLRHCRAMADAADDVQGLADRRADEAARTLSAWRGPHAEAFRSNLRSDDLSVRQCVLALRHEADSWAQLWADSINAENRRRHEAAVGEVSARRGLGEQLVDVFVGDDSADQVEEFIPVAVPSAERRYAPTAELVRY